VKLPTIRRASRVFLCRFLFFWVAAFPAFTPSVLRAHTIRVSAVPGDANVGGGPVDSAPTFTARASTLTTELLDLLTSAGVKSVGQEVSDEFFTLDTARSWGSELSSTDTFIDVVGGGGADSVVQFTLAAPELIGRNLTDSVSRVDLNGLAGNDATRNPFVQGAGEFGLSIGRSTEAAKGRNAMLSIGTPAGDKFSETAVPEPWCNSLILLAGIMAALAHQRRRRAT
jgi:hypothetical protein